MAGLITDERTFDYGSVWWSVWTSSPVGVYVGKLYVADNASGSALSA
jgi:hypothetical protein